MTAQGIRKNKHDTIKKKFPEMLKECQGIVTMACKNLKISRGTYYRWYNEDKEFAALCDESIETTIDFVEDHLFRKIKEGDTTAIIFYLKNKGRKRGYGDDKNVNIGNKDDKPFQTTTLSKEEIDEITKCIISEGMSDDDADNDDKDN